MTWFDKLTGFSERGYDETRQLLRIEGQTLRSLVNGATYRIGDLELVSLRSLRDRTSDAGCPTGRLKVSAVAGNIRSLHHEHEGALFQVASQFNLLEMTSPQISPEHGVSRYENDPTQGPACAIAAGAATIYRNYFAPVGDELGQTSNRQLNALSDLGGALSAATGMAVEDLWAMQNGYALCTQSGLASITNHLKGLSESAVDELRERLCIGLHRDVEVTDAEGLHRPLVTQAFCSALPVAYTRLTFDIDWRPFAQLVLEAAYEATLLASVLNVRRGKSNMVFLTFLGGGAFGNDRTWIFSAITRALELVRNVDLDVRLVSHQHPTSDISTLVARFR